MSRAGLELLGRRVTLSLRSGGTVSGIVVRQEGGIVELGGTGRRGLGRTIVDMSTVVDTEVRA